jgi:hypothetical protein
MVTVLDATFLLSRGLDLRLLPRPRRRRVVVALIGAWAHQNAARQAINELSGCGCLVLWPEPYGSPRRRIEKREWINEIQYDRIDAADLVFVLNPGGKVDDTARREIEYARGRHKEVLYLEDET